MRNSIIALCMILAVVFCASCDTEHAANGKEEMVVEGWIDEGGYPVVILTKSLVVTDKYQEVDSLLQYLIRWARVTVSDGEKTVVLTGKYSPQYFPPYIYTTGQMRGEAGKTYTLDVEYGDFRATAITTIPEKHGIEQVIVEPCAASDTLYQLKIKVNTDKARGAYYQLFTCEGISNRLFVASYLGTIDGSSLRTDSEIPVYRSHRLATGKKYTPYFCAQDTLAIKLAHIDASSYAFWSDYSRNLTLAGNLFMAPTRNVRTNVKGATGYWCGMGADVKYVVIGDVVGK